MVSINRMSRIIYYIIHSSDAFSSDRKMSFYKEINKCTLELIKHHQQTDARLDSLEQQLRHTSNYPVIIKEIKK
jgi:hypothetical protein